MRKNAYQAYTEVLTKTLAADERVLGLVALGSMADASRRDVWSDHDFFVIVRSGTQEHFRNNLEWLPRADAITLQFRETEHGLKVMYADGHLVEFAVFAPDELRLAKINAYAVLIDRDGVAGVLEQLAPASEPPSPDYHKELLHTLSLLQVGAGRTMRGEALSGHMFIKNHALAHLAPVLAHYVATPDKDQLDNLDSLRRFEQAFPELGAELNRLLLQDPLATACELIELIERRLATQMPDYPRQAVETVRGYLLSLERFE